MRLTSKSAPAVDLYGYKIGVPVRNVRCPGKQKWHSDKSHHEVISR